jgi:hypothetical protein
MPPTQQHGRRGVFDDGEQRVVEPKHAHQITRARVSIGGLAPVNEALESSSFIDALQRCRGRAMGAPGQAGGCEIGISW